MSITINEIIKDLHKYKPKVFIQNNITISNFYYLDGNHKNFNSNCLYICKSSHLPDEIKSDLILNLMIVVDSPLPSFLNWWDKFNLILFNRKNIDVYSLMEEVQDLICLDSTLMACSRSIIEEIKINSSLDSILKIAHKFLENPIIITNSSAHLCSHYVGTTDLNDPIWENYINTGYAESIYLKHLYHDLNFRQEIAIVEQPLILDYPDFMNHRLLVSSIKQDKFNLAYIYVLESNKNFSKVDTHILGLLNKILLNFILGDKRFILSNNTQLDSLLYYLMNCDDMDYDYINNNLKSLNITLNNNLYLLFIDTKTEKYDTQKIRCYYDILNRMFYNHIVFLYSNKIYILYNSNKTYEEILNNDEHNYLMEFLKQSNLKVGFSQSFSSLIDFKNASIQCEKAIYLGEKLNPSYYFYYFDEYVLNNLVYTFIKNDDLDNLIDLRLKDFLKNENPDYIETLKVFCKYNGDMQETSIKLHIHYNTLKYRLQKIKDLYCMDINNSDCILKIKLSFIALSFYNKYGTM